MRMTPEQVALRAFQIVMEVMTKGSDKEGSNDTWLDKPPRFHSDKSIRHQITAQLEDDMQGRKESMVRAMMDICQQEYIKS